MKKNYALTHNELDFNSLPSIQKNIVVHMQISSSELSKHNWVTLAWQDAENFLKHITVKMF